MSEKSIKREKILKTIDKGSGVCQLYPTWVPRSWLIPGRRLKLHPDDIYILGAKRGGIDERWFASTINADNGPGTPDDEGLSYIAIGNDDRILLRDAVDICGYELLGTEMYSKFGGWKVYAKFFDNMEPIPHHVHQTEKDAILVGLEGKDESYYFPTQLNHLPNSFPYTFFGLEPGTNKNDISKCLKNWDKGDNEILNYSKAYKQKPGTGWILPAGILHAPGTLLTFEVQWASDIMSVFQSMVWGKKIDKSLLTYRIADNSKDDEQSIVNILDWEKNTAPNFKERFYLEPINIPVAESKGYSEKWVIYGKIDNKQCFSAKELTILPGVKVKLKDAGAYATIVIQGKGKLSNNIVECPTQIRYGELTSDEFFVTHGAAVNGVEIENTGTEPLVFLKYYGPDTHKDMPEKN